MDAIDGRSDPVEAVIFSDIKVSGARTVGELKQALVASVMSLRPEPEIVVSRDPDDSSRQIVQVRVKPGL